MQPSLHSYGNLSPVAYNPDGQAGAPIGYVYVVRGVQGGKPVIYTGSTAQELRARFSNHEWRRLITAETTTVEVRGVMAQLDIKATLRRTLFAARSHALRAAEQMVMNEVADENAAILNRHRAAAGENATTWAREHNVRVQSKANATVIKGGFKMRGVAVLQFLDLYLMYRDAKRARYLYGAYVFEDEHGQFTIGHGRTNWFADSYKKTYIGGEYNGRVVDATKEEWDFYKEEGKALYGYEDWLGDFQPGLLVPKLPVVPERMPIHMHKALEASKRE
jgi:hypothetical protein